MSGKKISIFDLFSPTDYRYYVKELMPYLTEESFIRYKSRVESNLAKILAKRCIITQKNAEEISVASNNVKAKDVYSEEEKTGHDIIAHINIIKRAVSEEAKTGVHRMATSYDIIDTANALRYKDAFNKIIIPDMVSLENEWIKITKTEKDTIQIGRTHLQHAEPITFGFSMAWYVSRFGKRILKMKKAIEDLEGKFSGAVGSYNSSYLFFDDPEEFEREIMKEMELNPTEISTQITQPEPMTDLMHYLMSSFAILANWADDMRNLQRPEIGEVFQSRGKDVSRSSTMPHKANPVGLENIKSLWKATIPFMLMMYFDQISDHQRDLTNSASQRYIPSILNQFDYSIRRAIRISKEIKTNIENIQRNFNMSSDKIIAEPLHLLLSAYGYPNSFKYISKLVDKSYVVNRPLTEMVLNDKKLREYLKKFTPKQLEIISDPSKYTGIASKKAEKIAKFWEQKLKEEKLI